MEVEEATVRTFVARNRQDRWLSGLATKKRRQQTVDRLHGEADFREDLRQRYAGDLSSLERELRRRGAPDTCHVIGGSQDGEDRALRGALAAAVDGYGGVLLVCVPGTLAVHFPEAPAEPFILSC